jgi:hypothetical protein
MSHEDLRQFLLGCLLINLAILLVWSVVYRLARERIHRLWHFWFPLKPEQFDLIAVSIMGLFKIGIILFNLVPYLVLTFFLR